MDTNSTLIFTFTLLLFAIITFLKVLTSLLSPNKTKPNLPPGPKGLPVVGNLLQLGAKPHQTLATLAKTHGSIMSLKLGQVTTIVMSSAEAAKGVLQIHDHFLSNRKIPDAMKGANHDHFSLPFIPVSQQWRELRKLCNGLLFSNKNLDATVELRSKKVRELYSDIHHSSLKGEPVNIGRMAFKTIINQLSNTIYSEDLIQSAEKAGEMKELVTNIMKEVGRPNLADCFPVLKMIDPHGIRRRTGSYFEKLLNIFKSLIHKRLELRNDAAGYCTKRDMLDAMLNDAEHKMDIVKIQRLSLDLFVAGTDTVTSTVEWVMAELLHNPHVMSKAKEELERVIGKGNLVEESDIAKLPYLRAIVKETFRLHPAVPLLLPRKAEVEFEMHGHTIPKGAQVLVNVWAIGRDPNLWDKPSLFWPERFLESEIDFKGRSFELTPFGGGRRICPGLPLAIRLVFLMLGLFINSFDWELEGGIKAEDMNMDENFGLTLEKAQPVLAVPIIPKH
ncbi:geraniol 8-hydroxylase-like [Vigna unguiculata]|uniref:Cytochrome P450 n=1 Tax=Vigna unguiculata TaxID=3917 RepID=A0A4D6LL65_VIGUN|nr:geraniol 8-hydroxylase-like [Vigna unguiculata]QCD89243.1 Cytochrome P450 [Vigna unguiculata]